MPWRSEWVDPEIFMQYKGVTVYHTYDNDDYDDGKMAYWFTIYILCGFGNCNCVQSVETCDKVFNVQELPTYRPRPDRSELETIIMAIEQAIDRNLIGPTRIRGVKEWRPED